MIGVLAVVLPKWVAILVIAVLLLNLAWQWFKRKVASLMTAPMPPTRIHVLSEPAPAWKDAERIRSIASSLEGRGFRSLGAYRITEMPGVLFLILTCPQKCLHATVYEHPAAGIWTDVSAHYENGEELDVTNCPSAGMMDVMPGRERVIEKTFDAVQLADCAEKKRRPLPCRIVTEANAAQEFEDGYAREMDWRCGRGGVTEEEVRRVAEADGKALDTEQLEAVVEASRRGQLACGKTANCPYEYGKGSDREIEGMPFARGDVRSCPQYGHVCPEFMEDFGLTVDDLRIRATIHCGSVADQLVADGKMKEGSPQLEDLRKRYQETTQKYPPDQFPQYY